MPDFHQILKQYWGYDDFRGIQLDIIKSIYEKKDTLGLMPTGGGKSISFQVTSMAMEGICIVITPLIALIKDQIAHLRKKGIKAEAIYSGMSHDKILMTLENCILGDYKFLYISPERISSPLFQAKVRYMNVNFITVDEAHCISQWGYDFRPSYLAISDIRRLLPGKPVLAITATATPKVITDIQEKLRFSSPNVIRMSFERKNLKYLVAHREDKSQEILNILRRTSGPAIIYTRSRKKTKEISEWLSQNGISALHYHAGLDNTDRDIRQNMWHDESVRVIVATNAFGMGIDKPNVKLVIHTDLPDSIEAYFQEAGRAGRDGQEAEAVMLYNNSDRHKLLKRINEKFPTKEYIRQVYDDICSYYEIAVGDGYNVTREFDEMDFCKKFRYFPIPLLSSFALLTKAGYITYRDEEETKSRIMFLLCKEDLYKLHTLPQNNEKLIQAILRSYGGVFSTYVYIDETDLAHQARLQPDAIYNILKALSQQHIIHYIPRKNTPYITFNTRRVETAEIMLEPEVYEIRKKEYAERIHAILNYAENKHICRSRILLNYFGENNIHNCGICDICRQNASNKITGKQIEKTAEAIMNLLAGNSIPLNNIYNLPFETEAIEAALQWLIDEEEVYTKDGMIILN